MEIKKYTFQTIVAPPAVRAEFTDLRDELRTSDKTLMQAFWNLGIDVLDSLKNEVANLEAMALQLRQENREMKAAAKDTSKFEVVYDASVEGDA